MHVEGKDADAGGADGPTTYTLGPLQYPDGAYDLPAAAVHAAKVQVEKLQELLAGRRVSRVQVEKVRSRECWPAPATRGTNGVGQTFVIECATIGSMLSQKARNMVRKDR